MKRIPIILTIASITLTTPFFTFAGEWKEDTTGYWYQNDDGSSPSESWQNINGKWYYFKPNGYMNVGWIKVSDKWYYCEKSGEMRTAELATDVFTFKFNEDGSCRSFYENTHPSTQAGWVIYGTSSLSTWADAIVRGKIVYYNGSYWATPDYANLAKNEQVVYFHDIASDNGEETTYTNRFSSADLDLNLPYDEDNESDLGIVE